MGDSLLGTTLRPAAFLYGAQLLSTLALFGLIWFVQIVHYPLFLRISPSGFAAFEAEHARRTGYVAAPLMIVELGSSLLWVAPQLRLAGISESQAILGAALAAATWVCTFALQVPLHNRLHRGFDAERIRQLIATNWIRTVLWTARAGVVLAWAMRLLHPAAVVR